ncbi:hypothetical protein V6N13_118356 [Hibiscus sabdariffa]|uniref:Uncharacterized protein n=1 Tax=Hibiscus sabdariffa TaxID=183260 RepID=A0ABR2Q811_9ROSI
MLVVAQKLDDDIKNLILVPSQLKSSSLHPSSILSVPLVSPKPSLQLRGTRHRVIVPAAVEMKTLAEKTMVMEVSLLSCLYVMMVLFVLLILFVALLVPLMKALASFVLYSLQHISLSLHHATMHVFF